MKLLDSTFVIDFLNNNPEARKKIEQEKSGKLFFTDLTVYEVSLGINHLEKSKRDRALNLFKEFIMSLYYLPLSTEASFRAAGIKANLIKKGITIDDIDCIIAAIGIMNNINIIITRNVKHFSVIENIKIESY